MSSILPDIKNELVTTWKALKGSTSGNGIYTHQLSKGECFQLCSAVEIPSKEQFVLIGFKSLFISKGKQLPIGDGFEFKKIAFNNDDSFEWLKIEFGKDPDNYYSLSLIEYIYYVLCKYPNEKNSSRVFTAVVEGVKDWQTYMQKIKKGRLSEEEELGLWGELFFLESLIDYEISCAQAVDCWKGPEKKAKDFVFPHCSQTKWLIRSTDFRIHIS